MYTPKKIGERGCVRTRAKITKTFATTALMLPYVRRTSDRNSRTVPVANGETCGSM
jgi:hypothetical protein